MYASMYDEALKKTTMGEVSFASIFASLRYVPWVVSKEHGSWLDMDKDKEAFMGTLRLGGDASSFVNPPGQGWPRDWGLVATPQDPAHVIWFEDIHIGGFEAVAWEKDNKALIVRTAGGNYIGREWMAFVPLDEARAAVRQAMQQAMAGV